PEFAQGWLGRGNASLELKRFDEAFAAYDKALALKPDFADAWLGRGSTFIELMRFDEAFAAFDRAVHLDPDFADAYWHKSLAKLCIGNFEEGWDLYEWRSKIRENRALDAHLKSSNALVRQERSTLCEKKIAILSDQGVGDEIMFATILPDLIRD